MKTARLLSLTFLLAACQQIVGLEERQYAAEAGDGGGRDGGANAAGPSADECADYCGVLATTCTPENKTSAYPMADFCTALCPHLLYMPGAVQGNNFQCRLASAHAAEAVMSVPSETVESCRDASPGGFGFCGSNCESYCQLYDSICGKNDTQPAEQCVAMCSTLRDDRSYNASDAYSGGVDSIQCRLAHLSAAAKAQTPHCQHAQIIRGAVTDPCVEPANCNDYCNFVMNVCKDQYLQYETTADCLSVCNSGSIDMGTVGDTSEDTLNCRVYHTYNALRTLGGGHCYHAGPGGDGHCGQVCPAYCKHAKGACGAEYTSTFPGGDADCLKNCAGVVGTDDTTKQVDLTYDVATGKRGGNNIQCRLYHTTKAFSNTSECASALGLAGGSCAP